MDDDNKPMKSFHIEDERNLPGFRSKVKNVSFEIKINIKHLYLYDLELKMIQ